MRKSKYSSQKTVVDGITFHSKKEAKRYSDLVLLQKAGEISDLKLQPSFSLQIEKTYRADFAYCQKGKLVIEDVKGFKTKEYITKRKFFKKQYPQFEFRET